MNTVETIQSLIAAGTPLREIRLSPHFTLHEATRSSIAARRGLPNMPNATELANLLRLCNALEVVRASVLGDRPIGISSMFRSVRVNKLARGAADSDHVHGCAADLECEAFGRPFHVAQAIAGGQVEFDQCINEYGDWVHFSITRPGETPRRELLTYTWANGERVCWPGLHDV